MVVVVVEGCVCGVGSDTLTACLLVCCYIRQPGRESGSSNRAIRTPRDPIDLLIDPLLPQLVQTTVRVYTATTGEEDMQQRRRGMGRAEAETLKEGGKKHRNSPRVWLVCNVSSTPPAFFAPFLPPSL